MSFCFVVRIDTPIIDVEYTMDLIGGILTSAFKGQTRWLVVGATKAPLVISKSKWPIIESDTLAKVS